MAESACPEFDDLALACERSEPIHTVYRYAVTMKPNFACEQNNIDILERTLDYCFGYPYDFLIQDKKYEMDSKAVMHLHFVLVSKTKLKSFYAFFRRGWHIHLKFLKTEKDHTKWLHYLKKGVSNDAVLEEASARLDYMFVDT